MKLNVRQKEGYAAMADNLNVVAIAAFAVQLVTADLGLWMAVGYIITIPTLAAASYLLRKE